MSAITIRIPAEYAANFRERVMQLIADEGEDLEPARWGTPEAVEKMRPALAKLRSYEAVIDQVGWDEPTGGPVSAHPETLRAVLTYALEWDRGSLGVGYDPTPAEIRALTERIGWLVSTCESLPEEVAA